MRAAGVGLPALPLAGASFVITAGERYHLTENGYGDFALDLVRTSSSGLRLRGPGASNEDYLVWDSPVTSPVSGEGIEVVRDAPRISRAATICRPRCSST